MSAVRSPHAFDRGWASSVEARAVVSLLAKHLEIERQYIAPRMRLSDDLGAAQLHLTEIVLALEARFDVDIPEGDVATFKTVDDIIACVTRARTARRSRARGA